MKGLFAKHQYVGLDIGHHSIKAVQLDKTPSGWKLVKIGQTPTPKDTIKDGIVIDPPVLGIVIKELLRSHHMSASAASIGVSGSTLVVRPVRMPKMSDTALRKSIRFEASRYVPNSVEDSYIDFEITGDAENNQMDVLIAAAPKDLVDGRVQACEHAGLEIENVEVGAFALMRAAFEAGSKPEWADKTVALIDIGAFTTNLVLITEGNLAMVRTIPQASFHLTEILMKQFKISFEDAESGKAQLNLNELIKAEAPSENRPLRTIQPQVDELLREIRRSINYWQTQQTGLGNKQIDLILLTGGGSRFEGLDAYMSHKLGIPTSKVNVFDKDCFWSDLDHTGPEWTSAIGLCIPLAKSAVKAKKSKPTLKVVEADSPVEAEIEEAAAPTAVEEPKKPARKKSTKKKAEEDSNAFDAVEETPEASAEVLAPPVPGLEVEAGEVPAAFRPAAPAADPEAAPAPPVAEAPAEAEAEKPAKKPLFSVFGKKAASAPAEAESAAEPKSVKPKFSLFGAKNKAPQDSPTLPSEEDAA